MLLINQSINGPINNQLVNNTSCQCQKTKQNQTKQIEQITFSYLLLDFSDKIEWIEVSWKLEDGNIVWV